VNGSSRKRGKKGKGIRETKKKGAKKIEKKGKREGEEREREGNHSSPGSCKAEIDGQKEDARGFPKTGVVEVKLHGNRGKDARKEEDDVGEEKGAPLAEHEGLVFAVAEEEDESCDTYAYHKGADYRKDHLVKVGSFGSFGSLVLLVLCFRFRFLLLFFLKKEEKERSGKRGALSSLGRQWSVDSPSNQSEEFIPKWNKNCFALANRFAAKELKVY